MYKKFKDFISRKFNPKGYYAARGKIYPKDIEELDALVNDPKTNLSDIIIPKHINDLSKLFLRSERTDFSGLENWDVSHVTDMNHMFYQCKTFTGKEIENWDIRKVKNIRGIFRGCDNFDADLSRWKFNDCLEDVSDMFTFCKNFTGKGLENWDVGKIRNMNHMFAFCKKFDADLSKWDLSELTSGRWVFENSGIKNISENFRKKLEI